MYLLPTYFEYLYVYYLGFIDECACLGRDWLYEEMYDQLASNEPTNRGIIVTGAPGTGLSNHTAILFLDAKHLH